MKVERFNGSQLKLIAAITMISDHIGYMLLYRCDLISSASASLFAILEKTALLLRIIGRISFPIFVFLLVEGYFHTKNRKKYLIRIGIFSLLSEVPYDLFFTETLFFPDNQNVFFTLFFSLCMMCLLDKLRQISQRAVSSMLQMVIAAIFCILSLILRTDYTVYGILLAAILFWFHDSRKCQCIFGFFILNLDFAINGINFVYSAGLLIGFLILYFYNGEQGKRKFGYFYYLFYPAHLLLLSVISLLLS